LEPQSQKKGVGMNINLDNWQAFAWMIAKICGVLLLGYLCVLAIFGFLEGFIMSVVDDIRAKKEKKKLAEEQGLKIYKE
jgi:uncharacterized membrane protein (DUF485 family)